MRKKQCQNLFAQGNNEEDCDIEITKHKWITFHVFHILLVSLLHKWINFPVHQI
jgi:hypothetical protein